MENNRKNVFEQYDIIAEWFSDNRYRGLMEKAYLDRLIDYIGKGASVLDLGCGTGLPIMGYLISQDMHVTGVDASHRMLDIAKANFPSSEFLQVDMRALALNRKFDAIVAWHSFFHLPYEDQPAMFNVFRSHLKTNGMLIFTSGKEHGEAWGINGGENLFHASLDAAQYRSLLKDHNFQVLEYKEDDPECGNATVWMAQLSGNTPV